MEVPGEPQPVKLGKWCNTQRNSKRNADIAAAVNAWKEQNDGAEPPPGTMEELPSGAEVDIGKWAQKPPKKSHILSAERIAALEEAGFSWDGTVDNFDRNVALLVEYKEKHGGRDPAAKDTVEVPGEPKPVKLGQWCSQQRKSRR